MVLAMKLVLHHGDCVSVLKSYDDGSIGAVVSDPPYGLEFMGKDWDRLSRNIMRPTSEADIERKDRYGKSYAGRLSNLPDLSGTAKYAREMQGWHMGWLAEVYRTLRPGGVIKAFSGSRTYHRLAAAMADAGFVGIGLEAWSYGSGFPKSKNISLFIDKAAGAVADRGRAIPTASVHLPGDGKYGIEGERLTSNPVAPYTPVLPEAKMWDGWGTALKPAWEPVVVGRKPE
jgi:hypothetical protein